MTHFTYCSQAIGEEQEACGNKIAANRRMCITCELREELQELRQFKKDALEVIGFYASTSSWGPESGAHIAPEDMEYFERWTESIGGKRAREFLSKYSEKKEGFVS